MPQPSPTLAFDDDLGDASAARIREMVSSERFVEAQVWLSGVRHWDARCFYVDAASRWPGRPAWLDAWVAASPGDAIPYLVRGNHAIFAAWDARGAGWEPQPGAGDVFDARLALAGEDLSRAAVLDGIDPTPHCLLLRVARGRRLTLAEKHQHFEKLIARDPLHRRGHTEMLRALSEKWGGSNDLMFQFARDCAARAPLGSPLHGLIAEAHVERWLVADRNGTDAGYWARPEVAEEIRKAAARSVDAPEFQTTPMAIVDRSYFAFCFSQMGDATAAKRQFAAMAMPHRWPWGMFGDPATLLLAARGQAMAAG